VALRFIVKNLNVCYNSATMNNLDFNGLNPTVAEKISPMVRDLLGQHRSNIHSFHLVGSAVIPDYDEKLSDINSVVLLNNMDLRFLAFLAPLGKKYGKKHIAAPLVMTPEYIHKSLDSFPVEFLDFKLIHKTVFGSDILKDLSITEHNLRLQCEREIKTRLIHVRQGYISSLGKKEHLASTLIKSITGSMALFRAIITLLGKVPPVNRVDVILMLGAATGIDTNIFEKLLALKAQRIKPSEQELHLFFESYYQALEATGKTIDERHV
jgi:hypothetical protein